jgi:hypothetical protein
MPASLPRRGDRASDRSTRILVEHEATHGAPPHPPVGEPHRALRLDESQRSGGKQSGVRGDRARRGERDTEAPDGRSVEPSEEHDGLVVPEDAGALGRVLRQPRTDRVHGDRLFGEAPLVDEQPPDRPVRVAVGACGTDPDLASVRKAKGTAPLDLHEEDVDGIACPGERPGGSPESASLDLCAAEEAGISPAGAQPSGSPRTGMGYAGLCRSEASITGSW